jgi:hypothetical protein
MTERLTGGISPEAQEALQRLSLAVTPDAAVSPPQEQRISLKDKPYADTLQAQPELEALITHGMDRLTQAGLAVPVFHITSRAVRLPDGSEQSTGYVENITQNGFRARDTNVAVFTQREDNIVHIADPQYFAEKPYKFLRAMAESLGRYAHHGSRTNKATLGEHRDEGTGLPTMLIIDASKTPLVPGSDYEDHFMLGETVSPTLIVGDVDLYGKKPINTEDVATIAEEFLRQTEKYIENHIG